MNYAEFEDVSRIEKYVMTDEEYDKFPDTYRKWKARKLAADPNWTMFPNANKIDVDHMKEEALKIEVGSRCETVVGAMRGEVKYVGKVTGAASGYWIGIKLDDPTGKNDGTIGGNRYFECGTNFGKFLRPNDVKVGDYPEIDEFDSDEDML